MNDDADYENKRQSHIETIKADPTRSAAQYAAQLLQIISMWGMSRDMARRVGSAIATTAASMSDAEFTKLAAGASIKGGKPEMGVESNESGPTQTGKLPN